MLIKMPMYRMRNGKCVNFWGFLCLTLVTHNHFYWTKNNICEKRQPPNFGSNSYISAHTHLHCHMRCSCEMLTLWTVDSIFFSYHVRCPRLMWYTKPHHFQKWLQCVECGIRCSQINCINDAITASNITMNNGKMPFCHQSTEIIAATSRKWTMNMVNDSNKKRQRMRSTLIEALHVVCLCVCARIYWWPLSMWCINDLITLRNPSKK